MADKEYTKTPWEYEPDNIAYHDKNREGCFAGNIVGGAVRLNLCVMISDWLNGEANAQRIVDCVNACEGINPEAIPDMVEALKDIVEQAGKTKFALGADLADSINVFGKQALSLAGVK